MKRKQKEKRKKRLLLLANRWKEKWLEKLSMILLPGQNLGLRGSNEGKTSLNLLSILMMCPLMRPCWYLVSELSNNKWWWGWEGMLKISELLPINNLKMWLAGREWALNWDLLLSFYRCKWIGISPVIALILYEDVLNAPNIQMTALLWSFSKIFRGYNREALW